MNGLFGHADTGLDGCGETIGANTRGHIGVKDAAIYNSQYITWVVDEFRLYYRPLNSVGRYLCFP